MRINQILKKAWWSLLCQKMRTYWKLYEKIAKNVKNIYFFIFLHFFLNFSSTIPMILEITHFFLIFFCFIFIIPHLTNQLALGQTKKKMSFDSVLLCKIKHFWIKCLPGHDAWSTVVMRKKITVSSNCNLFNIFRVRNSHDTFEKL